MAIDFRNMAASATARPVDQAAIDQGLRSYMLRVFNYMGSGLLLSGIVAVAFAQWIGASPREEIIAFYTSGLYMVAAFAPLGILLAMSFASKRLSATAMQGLYWAFTALMGVSLSSVFFRYGMGDIARVFFITAITFGVMSLWGYTTKRDLSGWGSFLFMGLIGIIVASIVNIFMQSSMMHFVISVIGVLVFTGLTAYDTQRIKSDFITYRMQDGLATKSAVMGAVALYLNFLNLFYLLLALFGNRE